MSTDTDLLSWQAWVRTVARRLDPDMIDDLEQEGMIALWLAISTHDPSKSPLNYWMKKHATWRMLSAVQAARKNPVVYVNDVFALPEASTEYNMPEYEKEVHAALSTLTDRERDYVYRRFWLGWSYSQLNTHFRSSNTSTTIWKSARRTLLDHLGVDFRD